MAGPRPRSFHRCVASPAGGTVRPLLSAAYGSGQRFKFGGSTRTDKRHMSMHWAQLAQDRTHVKLHHLRSPERIAASLVCHLYSGQAMENQIT